MLNVILLAAGQGLRMGGPNKLMLPFRGRTVLETTLGMTSSIQAGVQAAVDGRAYMICLADIPMISTAAYQLLATSFLNFSSHNQHAILLPRFGQARGNPVLLAATYREAILQHSDPEGCRGVVQANEQHLHWVNMPDDGILRDLDTPNDYTELGSPQTRN